MATFTIDDFRERYPEFNAVSTSTVQAALTLAGTLVTESVWGELWPSAIGLKTASLIVQSPNGFRARPSPQGAPNEATYTRRLAELRQAVPRRGLVLNSG